MKFLRLLGLLMVFSVLALLIANQWGSSVPTARGKSPSMPITDTLTPEQALAQDLALSDVRVQDYTVGLRSEVFGVREVLADQYTAASAACATADCRQVEIYIFDQNAAVTAIVNVDAQEVLDVLYQPGIQPGINKRLAEQAVEIAINAPEVIEALGFKPTAEGLAAVPAGMPGTACDGSHLCAAPTFKQNGRFLWAMVDLTEGKLAGINWTEVDADGNAVPFTPEGCPPSGSVTRDGWDLDHEVTGTDSMRVYNVTYNGVPVATSIKLAEWHADYGSSGFTDSTGCGGGGGGFPIYPFGNTQVLDIEDDQSNVIGFEVVQDFRMGSWGSGCNYRYEQRIQFFNDGRFRTASLAYGKGCGTNAIYRPLVRVDMAVNGDGNDSFAYWDDTQWVTPANELYRTPYAGSNGPHFLTAEGYAWRVTDQSGNGYYLEPSNGQFGDESRGDEPFVYAVQHHANEGDTDLGIIGGCCGDDHQQGPHNYVNNEALDNQNIVLWYVPQMETDATGPDYYCWTITGDPNPETYPCWSGPMFVPINQAAVAQFSYSQPAYVNEPVSFTNESLGTEPITYTWNFGDGSLVDTSENPVHTYTAVDTYTVVLTASNSFGNSVYSDTVAVTEAPVAAVAAFTFSGSGMVNEPITFTNESVGTLPMSFAWDFGDGNSSTDENPTHIYTSFGSFTVTLTATNEYGSDVETQLVEISAVATAHFSYTGTGVVNEPVTFTNETVGSEPITYLWDFGDGNSSTDVSPTHTYTAAGTYTVTLTATNNYGSHTFSTTVTIVAAPSAYVIYLPAVVKP